MRIHFRSAIFTLAAAWALHSPTAAAWINDINCEGGTPGAWIGNGGAHQFSSSFSLSVFASSPVATGSGSCQMGVTAGSDGWGQWGAIYSFPSNVTKGGSVWARVSLFVPTGFSVATNDGFLKFMRIHTATSSGGNVGYHDLLISNPGWINWSAATGQWTSSFIYNYEGAANLIGVGVIPTNNIVQGTWETYEMNIKFDNVAKSAGGTGEVRIWKNNVLLKDVTTQPTIANATDYSDGFYLFTFWNGNAPATQHVYVDDVIITSDTPTNKDAAGNACLCAPQPGSSSAGTPGTTPSAVTPDPPTNVSVQ